MGGSRDLLIGEAIPISTWSRDSRYASRDLIDFRLNRGISTGAWIRLGELSRYLLLLGIRRILLILLILLRAPAVKRSPTPKVTS